MPERHAFRRRPDDRFGRLAAMSAGRIHYTATGAEGF
jgi:hypothetical protein